MEESFYGKLTDSGKKSASDQILQLEAVTIATGWAKTGKPIEKGRVRKVVSVAFKPMLCENMKNLFGNAW